MTVHSATALREKRLCSEFSGPHFPAFGLYSVRMRENTDQKNSEYGHFSRSAGMQGKKQEHRQEMS